MLSVEARQLEERMKTLSIEDKQWLLQQLNQQLMIQELDKQTLNQQQKAKNIISETLIEALSLPDNCYEKVWQNFESVCTKISEKQPKYSEFK